MFVGLCLVALVWHDLHTRRRIEPATLWGIAASLIATFGLTAAFAFGGGLDFVYWLGRAAP